MEPLPYAEPLVPERNDLVQMSIPEGCESVFDWFVSVAPQFRGWAKEDIARYFFELGLRVAYEEGLQNITPLDEGERETVEALQRQVCDSLER